MKHENHGEWWGKDSEIRALTKNLQQLVDKCLHNMGVEEMETIQENMSILIKQGMFWLKEENPSRFAYDLRAFCVWLCDYIEKKENEFWNEEE